MVRGASEAVEVYLSRATALLPLRRRQRVRAELHANLYQTMLDARLGGLDTADAWAVAVREAGPAWWLALQLARVHTLGLAVRALLVGAVLGGAAYAVGSGTHLTATVQDAVREARP